MKQFLVITFLWLCSVATYCQGILDYRMCDVYMGKVKSIVVTSPETMSSETEFHIDGKIKSMKNSMCQIDYEWKGEEEIKFTASNSMGAETFYICINEYQKGYYDFDIGEGNMKIWFRENGSIDKKEVTENGNKMITTYFYHSDSEMYPYKIENRMGTQSQVVYIKIEKCDSEGNAIVFTQSCNGMSMQIKRNITYFK